MPQQTIVFLSYYKHHARLFHAMGQALPQNITAKHLNVYPLTLGCYLTPPSGSPPLSREVIEEIIDFYQLKKSLLHPRLHTPSWRKRLERRAAQWYHLFYHRLANASLLVVWNGFAIPLRAAVAAARMRGIPVAFCENGVLPGTMAIDPKGINYANSLSGLPADFFREFPVEQQKLEQLLNTPLQQRPLRKASGDATANCDDGKPLPKRYLLFAMQVHDDSQVLLFSPRFRSMEEVVPYVYDQVCQYNTRTGDTLQLVVKEHPSDFGRIDYRSLRYAAPDALFLRTTPIHSIIGNAQAVVTINSSVGLDGLLYMRPVITLGDAFYNIPGITRHLADGEELRDLFAEVIDHPVDRDLITRFLYFLRYEFLIPLAQRNDDSMAIELAAQRLQAIMGGRLLWENKPISAA